MRIGQGFTGCHCRCTAEHGTRLFLPWHRAYLYFFELALRDLVPDAALAWWDWTSAASHATGYPAAFAERTVGAEPNPLYQAAVPPVARQGGKPQRTSRAPGSPADLPTRAAIQSVLALSDFLDFQGQLEEIHNAIHVWVGGTMGEIPWAAYDPVFFAHHTMIDRIWRLWQMRHPAPHLPTGLLDPGAAAFPLTVAQTLDVKSLGYDYASTTTHATQ